MGWLDPHAHPPLMHSQPQLNHRVVIDSGLNHIITLRWAWLQQCSSRFDWRLASRDSIEAGDPASSVFNMHCNNCVSLICGSSLWLFCVAVLDILVPINFIKTIKIFHLPILSNKYVLFNLIRCIIMISAT